MTAFDKTDRTASSRSSTSLCALMKGFRQSEDGILAKPMIMTTLLMLMVGGIGIDLMRYERDRTLLQYTLDRAVLAAADLDQEQEAEAVVLDYLEKAGLGDYYQVPFVEEGLGYRIVDAEVETPFAAQYLNLFGDAELDLRARARAEESVDNVEITLVLDISGSMGSNNRLPRLKEAAKSFIEQIHENTPNGDVVISIVPYASQVNAGATLLDKYSTTQEHRYSHCVNFIADEFKKTELDRTVELERTGHFDPFTWAEGGINIPVCPVREGSEILAFSKDIEELKAHIDSMTAQGNTSIDIGMKWGATLVDPSTQSVVTDLIADGVVDASLEGYPTDYDEGPLKVIILMSDGQNTTQYMLNPSRRDGPADVWFNETARNEAGYGNEAAQLAYSIERTQAGETQYWWPYFDEAYDHPYGNSSEPFEVCTSRKKSTSCNTFTEIGAPNGAVELTYPELNARASIAWIANYIHTYSPSAWADWYQAGTITLNRTAKDQHAKNMCDRTKDKGVIIYSIGFEAPSNGTKLLKNCASSDSHFFDVEGLEISDAFTSIATSIRQLRLTQ